MASIWHSDFGALIAVKTNESGSVITSFGLPGAIGWGLALDSETCLWDVAPDQSIYKLNQTGSVINQQNVSTPAGSNVRGITIDGAGCLWTTDYDTNTGTSKAFQRDATFPTSVQASFTFSASEVIPITRQADDSLWIGRPIQGQAAKYDQTGSLTTDSFAVTSSELEGFGIDTNESIWSTDASPAAIEQYDQTGTVITSFQTTTSDPVGVTTTDEPISATTGGTVTDTAEKSSFGFTFSTGSSTGDGVDTAENESFGVTVTQASEGGSVTDTAQDAAFGFISTAGGATATLTDTASPSPFGVTTIQSTETTVTAGTTFSESTETDWDSNQSESGVHHEQPTGTDWAPSDQIEMGYPSFDEGGSSLVSYVPMNESSSPVNDVANANTYPVTNGSFDNTGLLGETCVEFPNGTTQDEIDLGSVMDSLSSYTVCIWFNRPSSAGFPSSAGDETIISLDDTLDTGTIGGGFELYIEDGDGTYKAGQDQEYITTNVGASDDNWDFLVVTYDGTDIEVFINGTSQGTDGSVDYSTGTNGSYIGHGTHQAEERNLTGRVHHFRAYSRVLSNTEITDLENVVRTNSSYWTDKKST